MRRSCPQGVGAVGIREPSRRSSSKCVLCRRLSHRNSRFPVALVLEMGRIIVDPVNQYLKAVRTRRG